MKTMQYCITIILYFYLTISNALTDNQLLESINTHSLSISTNTSSFWDSYLTNYLKINTDPAGPLTPATSGLKAELFSALKIQSDLMAASCTNDTQKIIDGTLSNSFDIATLITTDFNGIAPIGDASRNTSLNIDSILAEVAIPGLSTELKSNETRVETSLAAKNFIMLLMGAASPAKTEPQGDMSNDVYQAYLSYIWALNAQQGVALSNLYHVLRQREIRPGLGTAAGLTNPNGTPKRDASILEVEESRIQKRIGNPDWYVTMEAASPIELQRESLYVLSEIQRLLHLTRQQNERIMVSFATLISQGIDLRKALNAQAEAMSSAGGGGDTPIPSLDDIPEF